MIDCLIMGDSIAVGIGMVSPNCKTIAKSGISSKKYVEKYTINESANIAVISLGSNDGHANYIESLRKLRSQIMAKRVYWIMPYRGSRAVEEMIGGFNDFVIRLRSDGIPMSPDHVHPTMKGYKIISKRVLSDPGLKF